MNQHYHSTFGAVQESQHIFIETGFLNALENLPYAPAGEAKCLNILEVGFGTGLNALLTINESEKLGIMVKYVALEAFPLEEDCWRLLNYPHLFGSINYSAIFAKLHSAAWDKTEQITPNFKLHKIHGQLETYHPCNKAFNLIYFDAFGPDAQPELWTQHVFTELFNGLSPGGILVTYSVKGTVVRALRSVGFNTKKLPGPPGKRQIMRALKN